MKKEDMIHPMRRTSIVVNDLERSVVFYRDCLGMEVFWDQEYPEEKVNKIVGVEGATVRAIILRHAQSELGMVGLTSILNPEIKPRENFLKNRQAPDVMMLFLSEGIQLTFEKVKRHNFEIICPPIDYDVPERGVISGFTCYDPNGVLVAIQRLGPLSEDGGRLITHPLRRTTIVVSDLEASSWFYQRILGMRVFYDNVIDSEGEGQLLGLPGAKVKMSILQSGQSTDGMIGLMSMIEPPVKPRQDIGKYTENMDISLMFTTSDIHSIHRRLRENRVEISCPPLSKEIPGKGEVWEMTCVGPDRETIGLIQFP